MIIDALPPGTHALRPVRIDRKNDCFINYTATTFPGNPFAGCELYMRRAAIGGKVGCDQSDLMIDFLDKDGDILGEVSIDRKAFEYLHRTLKFRVDRE